MMSKKFAVILITLILLTGIGYWGFNRLGGNAPIDIQVIDQSPPTLVGLNYRGTPQDPKLEEAFNSVETEMDLHPGSKLHTIYYSEPAGKLDTMEVFVGIDQPLPVQNFETMSFKESKYLLATIKSSKWVMPNPTTVQKKLKEFAQNHQLELTGIFIDKIISETEVQVIAPIKADN
ncbi:hypothetical protein [Algoriphagus machipongonensis]|uniref:GyrI-like small molecule binding domain-containing protein n=1 Tax=Algoriphagus machipongonensis TaxID=388413 RepID=A3HYD2_9BACT|nr:hypothetical protein [Algoriphagus machipongonensis]EAZ80268.1 hypothetical protein ALPR1_05080 [Algoriphagus machipongonensis]